MIKIKLVYLFSVLFCSLLFARNPFIKEKTNYTILAYGWQPDSFLLLKIKDKITYIQENQMIDDFFKLASVCKNNYELVDLNGKTYLFNFN